MTIGEVLRDARLRQGMTRQQAAPLLGIKEQYMYQIETDYRSRYALTNKKLLARIAIFCDCTVEQLEAMRRKDMRTYSYVGLKREAKKREDNKQL
jgi:transcriptional regulator with XRE-family HTH domain